LICPWLRQSSYSARGSLLLSEMNYEHIKNAWEDEAENEALQDMADLRLSKMISYLSKVRLSLASTKAEESLQADILTQEALNLEFMLEDLLALRRDKIMKSAVAGRRPTSDMTLAEEEFYNRIQRAFDAHSEFLKESLAGSAPSRTKSRTKRGKMAKEHDEQPVEESDEMDQIVVKFLRPIDEAFMGLDEQTYGPFKKEDIATIPTANARRWLSDGTAVRVVLEDGALTDEK
jgi:DNA replication initiation complex subunit (GINS family)